SSVPPSIQDAVRMQYEKSTDMEITSSVRLCWTTQKPGQNRIKQPSVTVDNFIWFSLTWMHKICFNFI
ncbi:hypothetical protein JTB14_011997, partial [Gonioctena quinquepunctata]